MEYTAKAIADILDGEVIGNPRTKVNTIAKIQEAHEGALSFLANPMYENYLYTTKASIVLVNKDFKPKDKVKATLIKVDDAYKAFATLVEIYQNFKQTEKTGIEEFAFIDPSAQIGKQVYIGSFSYIGKNVKIGNNVKIYPQVYIGDDVLIDDNTTIYPGVKIYHQTKIGKNCIIHSGTIIGSDGFGFAPQKDGTYKKIQQIGNVIIEDNVEIGANTVIDRATLGSTVIKKGVKLDNLIQIAHNVEIGENTVMAAQSGVSGSTKLGKNCMIGGQVGFVGHIQVADYTKVGAQAGVSKNVNRKGTVLMGSPAFEIRDFQRSYVGFKHLPDLIKKINELERQITKLEQLENLKKELEQLKKELIYQTNS